MKARGWRAVAVGVAAAALAAGATGLWRRGWPVLLPLGVAVAAAVLVLGGVRAVYALAGVLGERSRERAWAGEHGRHHAFAGVRLRIEDDGRQVWIGHPGLARVLDDPDSDDVAAARHAGHWRRADDGELLLRVDAVVRRLATMPGRDAPRTQRLRRYLERDVLHPAAARRGRPR